RFRRGMADATNGAQLVVRDSPQCGELSQVQVSIHLSFPQAPLIRKRNRLSRRAGFKEGRMSKEPKKRLTTETRSNMSATRPVQSQVRDRGRLSLVERSNKATSSRFMRAKRKIFLFLVLLVFCALGLVFLPIILIVLQDTIGYFVNPPFSHCEVMDKARLEDA